MGALLQKSSCRRCRAPTFQLLRHVGRLLWCWGFKSGDGCRAGIPRLAAPWPRQSCGVEGVPSTALADAHDERRAVIRPRKPSVGLPGSGPVFRFERRSGRYCYIYLVIPCLFMEVSGVGLFVGACLQFSCWKLWTMVVCLAVRAEDSRSLATP